MNYQIILKIIIIIVFIPSCSFAWFNRGLDDTLIVMYNLFSNRDLITLYNEYVHPDIKRDIVTLIDAMKIEKTDDRKIASRLGFASLNQYYNASHQDIVNHFFLRMISSRYNKPSDIKNSAYLRLAISLSLLFAFLDNGMDLIEKDIGIKCAILTYKGNNFTMKIYFYYYNNKWLLTDGRHCL